MNYLRHHLPTSVESFRLVYGRAPTVAEMRAIVNFNTPIVASKPAGNGCDCYDPECSICCDEEGNVI